MSTFALAVTALVLAGRTTSANGVAQAPARRVSSVHFLRFSFCGDAACKVRLGSRTLSRQIAQGADGTWAAALDTRPQPRQELCFEQPGATHWILEVRHAEAAIDERVSADERWKVIHTGEVPGPNDPPGN